LDQSFQSYPRNGCFVTGQDPSQKLHRRGKLNEINGMEKQKNFWQNFDENDTKIL
jgi:hypothetical protein